MKALNSAGAVSRVLSADIPSLNGKPAQFFELFQEAYLRELRTTAGDGIAQTELVPGTVSSGFAVSYLPRITGPGEVLVRLFASLRDCPSFAAFTSAKRYVYFWANGIYFSPRLDHDKPCMCVIIGADELGRKELLVIAEGYRESAQSWREVLLDLKHAVCSSWMAGESFGLAVRGEMGLRADR